jgi:hypothetical protein
MWTRRDSTVALHDPLSRHAPYGALANEKWLAEDEPHPAVELGAVAASSDHRRLAGRATRVP